MQTIACDASVPLDLVRGQENDENEALHNPLEKEDSLFVYKVYVRGCELRASTTVGLSLAAVAHDCLRCSAPAAE